MTSHNERSISILTMKTGTTTILLLVVCLFSSKALGLKPSPLFAHQKSLKQQLTPSRLFFSAPEVIEEKEQWTKPRFHNSPQFRSAAILGALVAAGASSASPLASLSNTAGATIHVLSFSTWFGTVVYTTFVAGITMFKNLPKQTFGKLQAKLFPKYFFLGSLTLTLQLLTLRNLSMATIKSQKALLVALVMTLVNQFILEPKSTDNMMQRYQMEDEGKADSDKYKKLKAQFGKFHGMSSLVNLIALCGGIAHAVYLAAALA